MSGLLDKIISKTKNLIHTEVQNIIELRYFPEIWYLVESWLSTASGKNVISIGCSDGQVPLALAKTGWETFCVDHDLNSLMSLQNEFANNDLEGRFEQCTPDAVPASSSSYSSCVLINTLEFSQEPAKVIQEVYRVLKPGGKAVIATFNRSSPWGGRTVSRALRKHDSDSDVVCLSKSEFIVLLRQSRFRVEGFKMKARYLPMSVGIRKLKTPITGCFVALVTKPIAKNDSTGAGDTRVSKM